MMASYTGPYVLQPTSPTPPGSNTEYDLQEAERAILDHYAVTANTTVVYGSNIIGGYELVGGTSATLTLYDNTSAAGTPIHINSTAVVGQRVEFDRLMRCKTGLYAAIGGSSSVAYQVLARQS